MGLFVRNREHVAFYQEHEDTLLGTEDTESGT
jgi:hypothetical protein